MNIELTTRLFEEIGACSNCVTGYTRPSYGPEEQAAHEVIRRYAEKHDFEIDHDPAGNLYVTLPGVDRDLPAIVLGSHLDTVPKGGLYDGAAGVVAGFVAIAGIRSSGTKLKRDVTVVAFRAEESVWFPASYIGSRAATGQLGQEEVNSLIRSDTGLSLRHHIDALGFQAGQVNLGVARLNPKNVMEFVEVHIEQGDILSTNGISLGLVSAVRGSFRYREVRCFGQYAHSGTTPHALREDAVIGFADLAMSIENEWLRRNDRGEDLVATIGIASTNPHEHGFSKVAGEFSFALDIRSQSEDVLSDFETWLIGRCDAISEARSVRFELGERSSSTPTLMDDAMLRMLASCAKARELNYLPMVSGAGHDAAAMAQADIPSAMVFVRNTNGSHNPNEAMDIADLDDAISLLDAYLRVSAVQES